MLDAEVAPPLRQRMLNRKLYLEWESDREMRVRRVEVRPQRKKMEKRNVRKRDRFSFALARNCASFS